MATDKDPDDPVVISFTTKDPDISKWIDEKLSALHEADPSFYVQMHQLDTCVFYSISTKAKNLEHDAYKRFMFQAGLKLGYDVKIR